ncbi:MAG: hypothetical protein WC732_09345 [Candidatus Omnitrophota bacterium]
MDKRLILIMLCAGFVCGPAQAADKITLKDGRVYEGKVLGKSDRRYLFSLVIDGEALPLSFFLEDVEKIELDKQSVDRQIPYLKEVESLKVPVTKEQEQGTVYEFSMYKKGQQQEGDQEFFTKEEIRGILDKEEFEYYENFTKTTNRHADKLIAIDSLYQNLPTATPEDFAAVRKSLDQIYFELNRLVAPAIFKESHQSYLQFIQATYMVFGALDRGLLDEASRQIKDAEQAKRRSLMAFRKAILDRKKEKASEPVQQEKTESPAKP